MADIKVWYILTDKCFKPLISPSSVILPHNGRMLPMTPSFPCNETETRLGRAPIYAAFSAAKVLLKNIQKDAQEFIQSSSSAPISPFPYLESLRRFPTNDGQQEERMSFWIIKSFEDGVNRLLYIAVADTSSPKLILCLA